MKGFVFGVAAVCAALFWWSNQQQPGPDNSTEATVEVSGAVCAAATRYLDNQTGDRTWREDLGEIAGELGDLVGRVTGGHNPAVMVRDLFTELEHVANESPGDLDNQVIAIASRGADHAAALAAGVKHHCA